MKALRAIFLYAKLVHTLKGFESTFLSTGEIFLANFSPFTLSRKASQSSGGGRGGGEKKILLKCEEGRCKIGVKIC